MTEGWECVEVCPVLELGRQSGEHAPDTLDEEKARLRKQLADGPGPDEVGMEWDHDTQTWEPESSTLF